MKRVTVTLPAELVEAIDRLESNRSRFVAAGVRLELERRRREELGRSLAAPHAEAVETSRQGFDDWAESLPEEDAAGLVDASAGRKVRWTPGGGWAPRAGEPDAPDEAE